MKKLIFTLLILSVSMFLQAKNEKEYKPYIWDNIVTTTDTDVYIDSTDIKQSNGMVYARIKTVYTTPQAKANYINNIKKVFTKNADKKIKKWEDFEYNITYGIYDCSNARFKILEVEDYDSNNKQIVKTKKKEDKAIWLNVDTETVGDYTLFNICDYQPEPTVMKEATMTEIE